MGTPESRTVQRSAPSSCTGKPFCTIGERGKRGKRRKTGEERRGEERRGAEGGVQSKRRTDTLPRTAQLRCPAFRSTRRSEGRVKEISSRNSKGGFQVVRRGERERYALAGP